MEGGDQDSGAYLVPSPTVLPLFLSCEVSQHPVPVISFPSSQTMFRATV